MKELSGLEIAGFTKERHRQQVQKLRVRKIFPKLAIVKVLDDPVINTYVNLKKKYGEDIGVAVDIYTPSQKQVPELLKKLNEDESVSGIIVQLPLEDPSQTEEIVNLIDPKKDVDALGDPNAPWPTRLDGVQGEGEERTEMYKENTSNEYPQPSMQQSAKSTSSVAGSASRQAGATRGSWFEPATPTAILWLLAGNNIDLKDKKILLIGRGKLVGGPLETIFKNSNYDFDVADKESNNTQELAKNADVIIAAANAPAILMANMVKPGVVIVDAGTANEEGKTVGNAAADLYERDDITITPRKGGVGPLTVCALFENVIRAAGDAKS